MDIRELKKLLKNSTSILVLDDGEPAYVIVDYNVYRDLVSEQPSNSEGAVPLASALGGHELEVIERLNKEIQALKGEIEEEEKQLEEHNGEENHA